jgi:hypothetical protein
VRFLFPLFLAGAAAVAVPILLHMARRRTRRQVPFSSLMFLTSSPPRFERRQRIEDRALLALRCLVLLLLAAAFARPFLPRPLPAVAAGTGERLVVLVDTSASMRRGSLWSAALDRTRDLLARTGTHDRVAVIAFDRRPRTVLGFEDWTAPAEARAQLARERLAALGPSWQSTDLGRALVAAAEAIVDDEGDAPGAAARVMVISDLQEGSRLEALGLSDWPARIELRVWGLDPGDGTNVSLQALPDVGSETAANRVRVTSTPAPGGQAAVKIRWAAGGAAAELTLPAGQTRVIDAPARPAGETPGTLVVEGDAADFDNQLHLAPPIPARVQILYLGADDGTDAQKPLYYLRRAFPATRLRAPEITARRADGSDLGDEKAAQLAVVTAPLGARAVAALRAHLGRGRTVLVAMDDVAVAGVLEALAGVSAVPAAEARSEGYALLTEVNLGHPLLAPFADPRFGDFTKIRFWKHRRLDEKRLPGARVLARFDDGAPAWLMLPAGRGSLFVMTAGWHPADSQLALSTKFVPLLHGILEASAGLDSGQAQFFVGDPVALPVAEGAGARRVRRPDGKVVTLAEGGALFAETDLPGLYTLEGGAGARVFAVNLDPAESATAPMPPESLERLGLLPGRAPAAAGAAPQAAREGAFFTGLERDQRLWRWLVAAVLVIVLLETLVATRASRRTA